jgi:hypothetical protein
MRSASTSSSGCSAQAESTAPGDPWQGKELSALAEARPMPTYAVLKRLGPSGLSVGGNDDLGNALRIAYEAFVAEGGEA